MIPLPMVFPHDYNGAINASRTTELRPTEFRYHSLGQVEAQDKNVIDFEESKQEPLLIKEKNFQMLNKDEGNFG